MASWMQLYQFHRREHHRKRRARSRAVEILEAVSQETAAMTGGDFFRSLLRYLASAFEVRRAFITECTDQTLTRVRTIALFEENTFQENVEYDLSGTPCQGVIGGAVCYYPKGLAAMFTTAVGMDAYLGLPLQNASGQILGHLALIDDKPMRLSAQDRAMLKIFADRAGMELERKYAEEALRVSEQQLRQLNEQLTDYNRSLEAKVSERTREIERRRQVAESLRNILAALNANATLDEILRLITRSASQLLDHPISVIYLLDAGSQELIPHSTFGAALETFAETDFLEGLRERIMNEEPVAIGNMGGGDQPAGGFRALLVIPIVIEMKASGCLALFYLEEREFSKEDIGLALTFGDQVSLIIENAFLRQRARQAAVMEERARLARELHDSVTQSLYSLTLLAEGWQRQARAGKMAITAEPLVELGEIAQQALKEMRLLVFELRPSALEQEGLAGALLQRLNSVEKRAGVETQLDVIPENLQLSPVMEEGLYRIAQEALNNALKHAAATQVTVRIRSEPGEVLMEIEDNGSGFNPPEDHSQGGIGLASMRERAEQLGGVVALLSAPGQGTCLRVRIKQQEVTTHE